MAVASGPRSTAIFQLLGLVYLVTIYPFVLVVGLIGGLLFMVSDVLLKLLLGRSVDDGSNWLADWEKRLFSWPIDQLNWIVMGDGSFPILP